MNWFLSLFFLTSSSLWAIEPSTQLGKEVFELKKFNSCSYCHGMKGEGGKVHDAANLTRPKTWKIFKILGGPSAYAQNKSDFLDKMHQATVNLIRFGAAYHNLSYASRSWFTLKKVGSYNSQMLGLKTITNKKWLKLKASDQVTARVAAESAYLYVMSLDQQRVFAGATKNSNKN